MSLTLNGIPNSILKDSWWLTTPNDTAQRTDPPLTDSETDSGRGMPIIAGLLVLILLADLLFWNHAPGISVALFGCAIFAVAQAVRSKTPALNQLLGPIALTLLGTVPVVIYVQALSVLLLALCLSAALIWVSRPDLGLVTSCGRAVGFVLSFPVKCIDRVLRLIGWIFKKPAPETAQLKSTQLRRELRNWAFPIGGSLVFIALLLDANPVFERLLTLNLSFDGLINRGLFWTGTAFLVAPLVDFRTPGASPLSGPEPVRFAARLGINAGSTLRALMVFNALICIQMLSDAAIILGGAQLPDGMSFASYAHRGAYPLLATALLAGGFAMAATPFLKEHRLIKPLMLLWLAQNAILCGAAIMRLDLYVEAYGLTYLRVYAFIWMGLVAIGLLMTLWQVWTERTISWLLARLALLAFVTLFATSMVNIAQAIARNNIELDGFDIGYLCELGPTAAGPVAEAVQRDPGLALYVSSSHCAAGRVPQIGDWREWGFRNWQVARYVARVQDGALPE